MSTMLERLLAIEMRDWTPKVLAILTLLGYFGLQFYLMTHVIDHEMREMVMRALGTSDALITMVFSYYYSGSNKDTKKQQIIQASQQDKEKE